MGGEEKEERGEATCSIYRTEEERREAKEYLAIALNSVISM